MYLLAQRQTNDEPENTHVEESIWRFEATGTGDASSLERHESDELAAELVATGAATARSCKRWAIDRLDEIPPVFPKHFYVSGN